MAHLEYLCNSDKNRYSTTKDLQYTSGVSLQKWQAVQKQIISEVHKEYLCNVTDVDVQQMICKVRQEYLCNGDRS